MARKLRACVACADLSEVGLNHPFLVGYVTEAASFAHAPRTRRRLSGTLPEKFGTLPEKSGKFRLSSDISDGGPMKFDGAQAMLSFD